jgi:hypothetical protein
MKKLFFVSLLFVFLTAAIFAQESVTTRVTAIVGANLTVTTTMSATTTIDPALTSATLGNVTISSNLSGGWKITVNSLNGGAMVRQGGTERYPYLLNFGTFATAQNLATDLVLNRTGIQTGTTSALSITYSTAASLSLPAGTYEDTLTISLAAL